MQQATTENITTKRYPRGPSFFEAITLPLENDAYINLNYPIQLTKKLGEVFKINRKFVVLTGAKGFEHIFKINPKNYSKKNFHYKQLQVIFDDSLLVTDGDAWKHRRKISSASFHPTTTNLYIPAIVSQTEKLIAEWKTNSVQKINLFPLFGRLTLKIALEILCNETLPEKQLRTIGSAIGFGNWYITHTLNVSRFKPSPYNMWFHYTIHQVNQILLNIIRNRKKAFPAETERENLRNPHSQEGGEQVMQNNNILYREESPGVQPGVLQSSQSHTQSFSPTDLLQRLIQAKSYETGDFLTDHEILAEFKTLLTTGHETTACGLTWMFALLAQYPEYQYLVQQELDEVLGKNPPTLMDLRKLPLLTAVFHEAMRLYPSIWCLYRACHEEDVINGFTIRAGSIVQPNIYALHRNPDYWERPDLFYPPRFLNDQSHRHPYAYLPFITGPRSCIASNLAVVESLLVSAILLQSYRFEKIKDIKTRLQPCVSLRPEDDIFLKIASR